MLLRIYSILATNQLASQEDRLSDGSIFNGLQPSKMAALPCAAGTANKSAVPQPGKPPDR
jgi:hypothetical protein